MRVFIDANNGENNDNSINIEDFFDFKKPCFFDGCDKLRQEMSQELNKVGAGCSSCRKKGIYNKYRRKVQDALKKV